MTGEREVVERFVTAVLMHDDETVQAPLLHPDVVVCEPPSLPFGGEHRGRRRGSANADRDGDVGACRVAE